MAAQNKKLITGYKTVVISSLVSIGDIVLNFIVALLTGSTVMFAQALQGVADLTTTTFLLLGVKRSEKSATVTHPFGYGRELFFWVLIASLFAFLVSGWFAVRRAVEQILNGGQLEYINFAILILTFGLVTNGYSLSFSIRRLSQGKKGKSFWEYIRHSSLVETKMTLLVDFMGTLSAMLGLTALVLYKITGNVIFDGVGALIIGLLTAAGALIVIIDLHDLIVGRSPHPQVIENIRKAALSTKGVQDVLDLRAISIGSEKILVILEVHFKDNLNTDEIEEITDRIKERVKKKEPQVTKVQVEAETPEK